jgi:hypothetical protein
VQFKNFKYKEVLYNIKLKKFEYLVTKTISFWDMTPCSPLSVNRRFGGTYSFHLQGREKVQQETSEQAGGLLNLLTAVTICTTCFNTQKLSFLPTECIYAFHMVLVVNSD